MNDSEKIVLLVQSVREAFKNNDKDGFERSLHLLTTKVRSILASRDGVQAKLDAICNINEDDGEEGSTAKWITHSMAGESPRQLTKDSMPTQDTLEK